MVEKIGLPDKRLFVYGDDTDYCLRIKKAGFSIFCVPSAKINRLRPLLLEHGAKYTWRDFYILRNTLFINLKYSSIPVKILRTTYFVLCGVGNRLYHGHFSDIPVLLRSFIDALVLAFF
ncbi:MAG: hypothetical protein QW255_05200 [Candidatus Bilamarchaeaceae archaeon]